MKRYNPDINKGLSDEEVQSRYRSGNVNYNTGVKTKTIGQIIFSNLKYTCVIYKCSCLSCII